MSVCSFAKIARVNFKDILMPLILFLMLSFFTSLTFAAACPSANHFYLSKEGKWELDASSRAAGWTVNPFSRGGSDLSNTEIEADLWFTPYTQVFCEYITGYDSAVMVENYNFIDPKTIPVPPFQKLDYPDHKTLYFCRTRGGTTDRCSWG